MAMSDVRLWVIASGGGRWMHALCLDTPRPLLAQPWLLPLQVLLSVGSTSRTVELMPTVTKVVDMVPSEAGRWQFYCDVHDHIVAGMRGTLVVA